MYLVKKDLVTPAERMGYKNDIDMFSVYNYTIFYSRSFDPPLEFIYTLQSSATMQRNYFDIF